VSDGSACLFFWLMIHEIVRLDENLLSLRSDGSVVGEAGEWEEAVDESFFAGARQFQC